MQANSSTAELSTLNPLGTAIAELLKIEAEASKHSFANRNNNAETSTFCTIATRASYVINKLCVGNRLDDDSNARYAALELFKAAVRLKEAEEPDTATLKQLDTAYRLITGVSLFEYHGAAGYNSEYAVMEALEAATIQAKDNPEASRELIASAVKYMGDGTDDCALAVQYRRRVSSYSKGVNRYKKEKAEAEA